MSYFGIRKDDEIIVPAAITEDIFHYAVHEGLAFSASVNNTSGNSYMCFKTPDTTSYLHLLYEFAGQDNCVFNIWEGVTPGVGGTDQIVYNKNRASAMNGRGASGVIAGNTNTVGSVQVDQAFSGGTQINPHGFFTQRNGGVDNAEKEFVLERNTFYGFLLDPIGTNDNGFTLTWFEVPTA